MEASFTVIFRGGEVVTVVGTSISEAKKEAVARTGRRMAEIVSCRRDKSATQQAIHRLPQYRGRDIPVVYGPPHVGALGDNPFGL